MDRVKDRLQFAEIQPLRLEVEVSDKNISRDTQNDKEWWDKMQEKNKEFSEVWDSFPYPPIMSYEELMVKENIFQKSEKDLSQDILRGLDYIKKYPGKYYYLTHHSIKVPFGDWHNARPDWMNRMVYMKKKIVQLKGKQQLKIRIDNMYIRISLPKELI